MNRKAILLSILAACVQPGICANPDDVSVVVSLESGPYQEALAGFRETFNAPFHTFFLSKGETSMPKSVRLIVAIGGKAVVYHYENSNVPMISCVAPGTYTDPDKQAPRIKIFVSPPPALLIGKIKELQPSIKRLGVPWIGESMVPYGRELIKEGEQIGIRVYSERLKSLDELPDRFRAMKGQIDAFWVPPDPQLITPQSFSVMRHFAQDNSIPLFVSVDGLADKGAAASISVSFRDMGRKAGVLAVQMMNGAGDSIRKVTYCDHVELTINTGAAKLSGLSIPSDVTRKADRVIP